MSKQTGLDLNELYNALAISVSQKSHYAGVVSPQVPALSNWPNEIQQNASNYPEVTKRIAMAKDIVSSDKKLEAFKGKLAAKPTDDASRSDLRNNILLAQLVNNLKPNYLYIAPELYATKMETTKATKPQSKSNPNYYNPYNDPYNPANPSSLLNPANPASILSPLNPANPASPFF